MKNDDSPHFRRPKYRSDEMGPSTTRVQQKVLRAVIPLRLSMQGNDRVRCDLINTSIPMDRKVENLYKTLLGCTKKMKFLLTPCYLLDRLCTTMLYIILHHRHPHRLVIIHHHQQPLARPAIGTTLFLFFFFFENHHDETSCLP